MVGGAVVTFLATDPECTGSTCPVYAFNDPTIVRLFAGVVAAALTLAFLVIVFRVAIDGELPAEIGQGGAKWGRALSGSNEAIKALGESVANMSTKLDAGLSGSGASIEALRLRVAEIAGELNELSGRLPSA